VIKVTLFKSPIGYNKKQKDTVKALGLKKLNSSAFHNDTPQIRGMVRKVMHLVSMEEVDAPGGNNNETE
jgi:large subunit ribosomal protein L30